MKMYRVLSEEQALALCEQVMKLGWPQGKARTKELTGTTKQNREITSHVALQTLGKRIVNHPEIQIDCIPLKIHAPKFSRYSDGEHYKLHTDAPWMGETRTDLSCTLWLSKDYEGGELRIDGQPFKGRPGECLIYECGRPHEVTPVTRGDRVCVVTWIQSRIREPSRRRLISDFRKFLAKLDGKDEALFLEGSQIYSALLRSWIE